MDTQTALRQVDNWGYYLLPRSHPQSPGHPGLLVAIRQTPTQQHFDPEAIQVQVCSSDGTAESVTLALTSSLHGPDRVCPGLVMLHDRVDKRANFFTFGGSLEAISSSGETVYVLESPAPILPVTGDSRSISDQLAYEAKALLGKVQAQWGMYDKGFDQRLAQVEPLELYLATVHSILTRYSRVPALRQSFPRFYAALLEEKQWLARQKQWPATPAKLEDLLAPPD